LIQDIRYACRWLLRSPGFAAVAILSLGLGIGFNSAIFAVADALLLRPLPVAEPARLVDIYTSGSDGDTYSTNSLPDLQDLQRTTTAFDDVAGYSPMIAAVARGDRAGLMLGEIVTGNYFRMLGVRARLGRTLAAEDDLPGAHRVTVLSAGYWRREFGADPAVVGQTLRVRGQSYEIAGVVDDSFTGMMPLIAPELWIPARYVEDVEPAGINENVPSPTGTSRLDRRGQRWLFAKARLKPGVTVDQARANVTSVAGQLAAAYPMTNKDRRVTVRPTSDTRLHPEADGTMSLIVWGTMAAVGLVLVIACANLAGMLLARASARRREMSIRVAIGAGRGRLIRQLVTESVVLGVLGAAVGLVLAGWLTRLLSSFQLPIFASLSLDLRIDARVLAFTIAVALLTGVLAGLVPAFRATRRDLVAGLKGDTRTERLAGRRWSARDALVIGQVAVTVVLVVISGLLLRSLATSHAAEVGFRTRGLAIVSADTDMLRYTPERSHAFWAEADRVLRSLPGVEGVAFGSRLPFSLNFNRTTIAVPGHQKAPDETGLPINSAKISKDYFSTLRIPILQGRPFADSDLPDHPRVAIVNEAMARRYWPGETPLGRLVFERQIASGKSFEIVGVVADHKLLRVGEASQPAIFFADSQSQDAYKVAVARTAGDADELVGAMRRTLLELEPNLLLMEAQTMTTQIAGSLFPLRVASTLVAVFSALGLLLAAIGLYGVIAFAVSQRTREIGIRLAIGARPAAMLALVLRQGFVLVLAGGIVGALLAAAATRALAGVLYGVSLGDAVTWGAAALILVLVGLVANLIPARRAMKIDPVRALRTE
jgi:predicted permease